MTYSIVGIDERIIDSYHVNIAMLDAVDQSALAFDLVWAGKAG